MPPIPPSIRGALRKFLPHLLQAQEQGLKEADTLQRVLKVFEEVLGYDALTQISREALIKGKFVDLAVKLEGVTRFLVEVKAAGTILRDRHIDQARAYAADGNIPWVVLTNGLQWNLYHLTFEEGIDYDLVFGADFAGGDVDGAADELAFLHHDSISKGLHEDYWQHKAALGAQSIGRALFTDSVLRLIRREIRRSEGISIDEEDLVDAIKGLLSSEARELIGPVKIRRRRKRKKEVELAPPPTPVTDAPQEPPAPPADQMGPPKIS